MTSDVQPRSLRETWAAAVLFLCIALVLITAYFGPFAFTIIMALAGLLCMPLMAWRRSPSLAAAAAILLALWAAASFLWSPAFAAMRQAQDYAALEKLTAFKLLYQTALYAAAVAALAQVSARTASRALSILAFGMLATALVLAFDTLAAARLYRGFEDLVGKPIRPDLALVALARTGHVLAVLVWPLLGWFLLRGRRGAAVALVLATAIACVMLGYQAPLLGLVAGGAAYVAVRRWGAAAARVVQALCAAFILLAPFGMAAAIATGLADWAEHSLPASWEARTAIWRFAVEHVAQKPLFGWGLDASRTFTGDVPLHTHNAALQIWLELGAVGAVLAALLWIAIGQRVVAMAQTNRRAGAAAAGCMAAYLAVSAAAYGVWQEWWLGVGAFAFVLAALYGKAAGTVPATLAFEIEDAP